MFDFIFSCLVGTGVGTYKKDALEPCLSKTFKAIVAGIKKATLVPPGCSFYALSLGGGVEYGPEWPQRRPSDHFPRTFHAGQNSVRSHVRMISGRGRWKYQLWSDVHVMLQ
ncbi:unnamed protein product [Prorocentrum cordatum]|uniref:Uncharacterized protein n=1 Tax=Prorocentrum cordatum TaxID=2364126 RepID=A0ABN9V4D8_9DINO|nr:unnamed protein product [Polarella glacialis]